MSWHVDGGGGGVNYDNCVNGEKSSAPPPPLPPPNSNSAIEARLAQLQKAAVAIATGPGSIIAEDGKIAKALNLPAFAKSVKNSYVVSPSRKHPVSGLYAVTELGGKPPSGAGSGGRKIAPSSFSHPHSNNNNSSGGNNNSNNNSNNIHSSKAPLVPSPLSIANGKTSFSAVP